MNAIDTLRDRQASAKSYSVYGLEGKWLVDDGDWISLHAAIDAALAAVETLLQAAEAVLANQILVKYDNAADPMWGLAAAVRNMKGEA